jgi:hypothetical protein
VPYYNSTAHVQQEPGSWQQQTQSRTQGIHATALYTTGEPQQEALFFNGSLMTAHQAFGTASSLQPLQQHADSQQL